MLCDIWSPWSWMHAVWLIRNNLKLRLYSISVNISCLRIVKFHKNDKLFLIKVSLINHTVCTTECGRPTPFWYSRRQRCRARWPSGRRRVGWPKRAAASITIIIIAESSWLLVDQPTDSQTTSSRLRSELAGELAGRHNIRSLSRFMARVDSLESSLD